MKKIMSILGIVLMFVAPLAFAEKIRIAVVDLQGAVTASEEVKTIAEQLKTEFKDEDQKIRNLQTKLRELQEKQKKDGAIMSEAEGRKLMEEGTRLANELKFLTQESQRRLQGRQQELIGPILQRAQGAVEEVIKEGGFDIVLRREAVLEYSPDMDITKKVTAKLNKKGKK